MRYAQLLLLGLVAMALASGGATATSSQPPQLIDVVNVGSGPLGAAVNPADDRIYVANYHDDTVSVIDSVTHEIITTIAVSDGPQSIAVNTSTNRIYVGNGVTPTSLSVIDGATSTVIDTFPLGLNFLAGIGLAVNSETDRVYATSLFDNVVAVLDGTTGTVLATIAVGVSPVGVDVNTVTNRVYVTNALDDSISVIDGVTNSVISTIALNSGGIPTAIAVNPLTNRIYVANLAIDVLDQGSVSVIDGDTEVVLAVLPMDTAQPSGGFVQGIAVDSGANRIYVTDGPATGAGVLKVIDGATSSVVSAITLDPRAEGVAVNPQINRAYVTHGSNPEVAGKVSVLGLEGDGDYDGFADSTELFVGTNAVDACANTPATDDEGLPDAWPFDFNDNQRADLSDVLGYIPVFNSFFPIAPYDPRYDLDASGGITLGDVLSYIPVFNLTCTP
ncbi:MAG: YncE family protein [Chloroflexi bacterium]|nr:YncE family protein [Chloroflexota bacterium]